MMVFDGNDDNGSLNLPAIVDDLDFESLFHTLGQKSRGDENTTAGTSSNILPCNESASHGANEHSETHNGSHAFPLRHDSAALASRAFCSSDLSVNERQTFNSGFDEPHQDVFPMHFIGSIGVTGGIFENLVGNSYNKLEVADNMDLSGFSDMIYDPNFEYSMPHVTNIDTPFYFGSSRQGESSNVNDSMLLNIKTESEKHRMQNVPICNVMDYDIVAARPDGIALVDQNSDIGPYASVEGSDFLPRGKSSLSEPAKKPTSGDHGLRPCGAPLTNMRKKAKLKTVDEPSVSVEGSDFLPRGESSLTEPAIEPTSGDHGLHPSKLKTVDEPSVQQVPSQDLLLRKPRKLLPDDGLAVPLLKHQKETKSTRCCGGIIADDQGLGKTISAIALILKERSPPYFSCWNLIPLIFVNVNAIGTKEKEAETLCLDEDEDIEQTNTSVQTKSSLAAGRLVVCPTSVLRQWNDELQNKVINEANLSVLVYHGLNRTKDPFELAKYDVILTTYATVGMEVPKQPINEDEDETKVKISPNKKRKYPPTSDESPKKEPSKSIDHPLAKLRWFRVILDEAQSIKNYKTQAARACWGLRAKRRWCLSGTPIQNSVDDLYSYFRFLRYDPFAKFRKFCSEIKASVQKDPVWGYKKLQFILKPILLRRTKGTLINGEPIISLPPKTIMLKKVDFTAEEHGFYQSLEAEARAQFEDPPEDAVVTKCEHVFCKQCILEHLSSDNSQFLVQLNLTEDMEPSSSNGPIDSLKIEATKALESSKIKAALKVLQSISKPDDITEMILILKFH
nr:helicase, C-terminal [Tanacetum cinerariifolium]